MQPDAFEPGAFEPGASKLLVIEPGPLALVPSPFLRLAQPGAKFLRLLAFEPDWLGVVGQTLVRSES